MDQYLEIYRSVADMGERIGPLLFGLSLAAMVLVLVALGVLVYLSGKRDDDEGKVITDHAPVSQPDYFTGVGKMAFRSRRKLFISRSAFVDPQTFFGGKATRAQWLLVIGISAAFFFMSLTMIGVGLMLMKSDPTWIVAIPFGIVFFGYYALMVLRDRARVKRKLAKRNPAR